MANLGVHVTNWADDAEDERERAMWRTWQPAATAACKPPPSPRHALPDALIPPIAAPRSAGAHPHARSICAWQGWPGAGAAAHVRDWAVPAGPERRRCGPVHVPVAGACGAGPGVQGLGRKCCAAPQHTACWPAGHELCATRRWHVPGVLPGRPRVPGLHAQQGGRRWGGGARRMQARQPHTPMRASPAPLPCPPPRSSTRWGPP